MKLGHLRLRHRREVDTTCVGYRFAVVCGASVLHLEIVNEKQYVLPSLKLPFTHWSLGPCASFPIMY